MADTDKTYEILNYYGLKTNIEDAKKWIKQYVADALTGITTDLMTNVTYNELVSLRDNGKLKPGMLYRMTDYVTKVYSEDESISSAEHPFDLILFANTTNSLNENGFVCLNSNSDGYFDECNINVWEIKYSLDNGDRRFEFADTENSKGIIYYMKDDYNNEAPFDFKNILQKDGEYTFGNNGEDYSLNGYVNGVYNNKILPCVNSETGKQTINKIRVTGKDCNTNIFKPTCVNSYIDFPISECDISMNDDGELVVFKTADFISGIENHEIPKDMRKEYLTFEALNDDTNITFIYSEGADWDVDPINATIYYSINNGVWGEITFKDVDDDTPDIITINSGDKIRFKSDSFRNNGISGYNDAYATNSFRIDKPCLVYGNIMSLLGMDDFSKLYDLTVFANGQDGIFDSLFAATPIFMTEEKRIVLPATELSEACYNYMFQGCTSLTTAPELPATTLANYCYTSMFKGCTSLTDVPELPATTLAEWCYAAMFSSCSRLTTAPELPATTLASSCYGDMFNGCSSLNYIKCLAVNGINQNNSTINWVNGVASSGTFVKHQDATSWTRDKNGIPDNWTVEDAVIE
jgi:hypothetical protein